jgi:phosphoribosylformylglycinamidine synthase subunit PurL
MMGVVRDKKNLMSLDFKQKGDLIFLIGESHDDINSSEYLYNICGVKLSPPPYFDLNKEYDLQNTIKGLISAHLINAAHDCSEGGIWVTLVEMGMPRGLGFTIETDSDVRQDSFLFGESQSRVIVTVTEDEESDFIEFLSTQPVPFTLLGHVTKGKIVVDDEHFGFINEAKEIYDNALGKKIVGE